MDKKYIKNFSEFSKDVINENNFDDKIVNENSFDKNKVFKFDLSNLERIDLTDKFDINNIRTNR